MLVLCVGMLSGVMFYVVISLATDFIGDKYNMDIFHEHFDGGFVSFFATFCLWNDLHAFRLHCLLFLLGVRFGHSY